MTTEQVFVAIVAGLALGGALFALMRDITEDERQDEDNLRALEEGRRRSKKVVSITRKNKDLGPPK